MSGDACMTKPEKPIPNTSVLTAPGTVSCISFQTAFVRSTILHESANKKLPLS